MKLFSCSRLVPVPALALSLPVLFAPVLSAPALAQWKKLAPAKLGFSVSMPGTFKVTRESKKNADGTPFVFQEYQFKRGDTVFLVGCMEHHTAFTAAERRKVMVDGTSTAAKSAGATGAKFRDITLNGFPGREVTGLANGKRMQMRTYVAGRRVFFQGARFGRADQATTSRFFASLRLAKPQPR